MRLGQRPRQHVRRVRTNSGRKPTTINKGIKYSGIKNNIAFGNYLKKKYPYSDSDGDGVINKNDCRPADYNKQGFLHDLKEKVLEKKESIAQNLREKEQKKLDDESEKLEKKLAELKARNQKQDIVRAKKQAVIDEIERENKAIKEAKEKNAKIKKELFEASTTGKITKGAINVLKTVDKGFTIAGQGLRKAVTSKQAKNIYKSAGNIIFEKPKRRKKRRK